MAEAGKKYIARVSFTITSENGSVMFTEGAMVPAEIAIQFPKFMVGYQPPKAVKHDPTLPQKISKSTASAWSMERLTAWVNQYHPGKLPAEKLDKAGLVELAMELQGV